ncbi:MAG: type IV secretory system conjugative DNA transfer family protein [Verrucomicrobiales bacterium]|nr:type IV secretory system conjugative DNA transfer family protein [Verrucomicrobiales bacterium]MCP5560621.1 type IV secretory system conjugative DNA transfer family protein [Verrucomicrobiaceae bacterium]
MSSRRKPQYPTKAALTRAFNAGHLLLGWKEIQPPSRSIGFHSVEADPAPLSPAHRFEAEWTDNRESHSICIAKTGSGKGRNSLIPQLLTWRGSAVVVDPKGEAAAVTGRFREKTLGQKVIYLDPFKVASKEPDSLNPLDVIQFSGDSPEEFALASPGLLHPDHGGSLKDPFWDNNGDSLISALTCYMLACEPPEKRTFGRLRELLMSDDVVYNLAVLLDTMGKKMPAMARATIANFLSTADVTRSGILSTAQQHLRLIGDPNVERALEKTTFDLEAFRQGEPTTIYLILPVTRLHSHGLLLRCWLSTLFSVAMSRKKAPKTQTGFWVDEVAAIGALSQLSTAFTLLRGYGVKVSIYLQDLQQLKKLYPSDWETMVNNAGQLQIFQPSNHFVARQLAELFGKDVQPEDILRLRADEQILLRQGGDWVRCKKLDYLRDPCFQGLYTPNPWYEP